MASMQPLAEKRQGRVVRNGVNDAVFAHSREVQIRLRIHKPSQVPFPGLAIVPSPGELVQHL
eukprot:2538955-Rhodomonas_salina.1